MYVALTPWCAISTILCLTTSGSGRPLTKTPPSWLTPPWPAVRSYQSGSRVILCLNFRGWGGI